MRKFIWPGMSIGLPKNYLSLDKSKLMNEKKKALT